MVPSSIVQITKASWQNKTFWQLRRQVWCARSRDDKDSGVSQANRAAIVDNSLAQTSPHTSKVRACATKTHRQPPSSNVLEERQRVALLQAVEIALPDAFAKAKLHFCSLCLPASCNEFCPLLTACRAALKSDKLGATARCKPLCSADFSWSLKPAGRAADALTTLKFDQMDSRLPFAQHDAHPSPESRSSSQENFDCHCL